MNLNFKYLIYNVFNTDEPIQLCFKKQQQHLFVYSF